MRLFAFGALVAVAAILGCGKKTEPTTAPPPDGGTPAAPGSDKDRFQGVWAAVSAETSKGTKELSGDRAPRLQIEGDRVSLRESATDPGEPFTAVWDTTKNPKTITLTPSRPVGPDGKPFPGGDPMVCIYKFEGDTLVFAQGFGLAPADFKPDAATGVNVLKFKKTDEKPVPPRAQPPVRFGTRK